MRLEFENELPVVYLSGRLTASNAVAVEKELTALLAEHNVTGKALVLDVRDLQFLASAGIRIILKLTKKFSGLTIRETTPEVFAVLEMTGLTKIISVMKILREVSPEGAEIIGRGYAGIVYRLTEDLILKLYNSGITRELVDMEKRHAETAFLNGIPTAVSYDVVRHGEQFGIVFELMNAKTLAEILAAEPENFADLVRREAHCLRQFNATPFEKGSLPAMKDNYKWRMQVKSELLTAEEYRTLVEVIDEIPDRQTFLHGDFHPRNVMMSEDEFVLIDMADVALGHPIFELLALWYSFKCSSWGKPELLPQLIGVEATIADEYLRLFFEAYFETSDTVEVARAMAMAEKFSWLKQLVALPYITELPPEVRTAYVERARREFFPVAKNLVATYRDLLDAM